MHIAVWMCSHVILNCIKHSYYSLIIINLDANNTPYKSHQTFAYTGENMESIFYIHMINRLRLYSEAHKKLLIAL